MLGGGGGMLCVPALTSLVKLNTKSAHATAVFIMLPISIISSIIYSITVQVDVIMLVFVTVGSLIGALIGSKFLAGINSVTINYIFAVVMLIAGFKMII